MKTFDKIICLCGIMIFKPMLCSADDALTEAQLKKIYKFNTADNETVDRTFYKIIYGETIKKPIKKVLMKMEIPIKKRTGEDREESYVSREIQIFKDLKEGNTDLLSENIVDMLHHGYYDGKRVLIILRLGNHLLQSRTKAFTWDEISQMGPCMIKALRLLHTKHYVLQFLTPIEFAFGTEEKQSNKGVVPLKNQVYLFNIGRAEKYRYSNGSHRAYEVVGKFIGILPYASRCAMNLRTQSRRDDIESLYYIITMLSGIPLPRGNDTKQVWISKDQFCKNFEFIKSAFQKTKDKDIRILHALLEFVRQMVRSLFPIHNKFYYEIEPEYDDFINCFDQGLSEEQITEKYKFDSLDKFERMSGAAFIGLGNTTTDPKNKTEVVMKLQAADITSDSYIMSVRFTKVEIEIYKDLKKGMEYSLIRENICDFLDHGIYNNRMAIIMSRLGVDWHSHITNNFPGGYPFELLCKAARYAISAIRFLHNKGYIHRDIKLGNFAFGSVDLKKNVKSQADKPLKDQLYLLDFGLSTKWRDAKGTHLAHFKIGYFVGTVGYKSRMSLKRYTQSQRDDMESLLLAFTVAALNKQIFRVDKSNDTDASEQLMLDLTTAFVTNSSRIAETFKSVRNISDPHVISAFTNYAAELSKLFVSDEPEYFEKEPDYNAFCVCFGGKPGKNACAVE